MKHSSPKKTTKQIGGVHTVTLRCRNGPLVGYALKLDGDAQRTTLTFTLKGRTGFYRNGKWFGSNEMVEATKTEEPKKTHGMFLAELKQRCENSGIHTLLGDEEFVRLNELGGEIPIPMNEPKLVWVSELRQSIEQAEFKLSQKVATILGATADVAIFSRI